MILRYKHTGYNINIIRQSACLVLTQSRLINLLLSLITRRWVGRPTQWWPWHKAIYFSWLEPELFCRLLGPPGFNCWFSFAPVFQSVARHPRDLQVSVGTRFCRVLISVSSLYLSVIYLFPVMIHWWVRKPSWGPNNCMFWAMTEAEGEVGYRKAGFSPPVF